MDVWKEVIIRQLKYRNNTSQAFKQLLERNITLQNLERQLRTENNSLTQAKTLLQNRVDELEDKVKRGTIVAQSKEREDSLQQELNASLLLNANISKQLLEKHDQLKQNEDRYQAKLIEVEKYAKQNKDLLDESNKKENEIHEKEERIQILKGELQSLQTTLFRAEESVQTLKKENKRLEARVTKKLEDDVLKLNKANEFFQNLNSTVPPQLSNSLPVQPVTLAARTLLETGVTTIGASTLPKSSKKSFQVHAGEVNSIAFSATGAIFATAGSDKTVKIWDTYTLTTKQTLLGPERTVMQVAFNNSTTDEHVLAASHDNATRVWSLALGRVQHCLLGHLSKVYTAQFTYENDKIVTGSHDRTIKVWDLQKRFCLRTIYCFSSCNDLCLSRESSMIISGHLDHNLRFWDIKNGDCIKELGDIHSGQITGVILSPDGQTVLTSSRDNTLKIIDIRTYDVLQVFSHEGYRNGLNWTRSCFSPDGRYVASGSADGAVYVWDASTTNIEQVLKGAHKTFVTQVAWNPSGHGLASVDRAGYISLWG
jgi:autophagy-related protein 16